MQCIPHYGREMYQYGPRGPRSFNISCHLYKIFRIDRRLWWWISCSIQRKILSMHHLSNKLSKWTDFRWVCLMLNMPLGPVWKNQNLSRSRFLLEKRCENWMQIETNLLSTSPQMGDNTTCQLSQTWDVWFRLFVAQLPFNILTHVIFNTYSNTDS